MNKQHDLNKWVKVALKPLVFASCILLTLPQGFADDASKAMLNELSEEANNTKMANKQDESKKAAKDEKDDPMASLKTEGNEAKADDELSSKIEKQLRRVLAQSSNDGSEASSSDGSNTENELEKIVSASLLEGAKMDDIRSAVGDAMSEIKKEKDNNKVIAPERITEADKAFSKLTITKKEPAETKETEKPKKTVTPLSEVVVSTSSASHPETVTVQEGESLFKIALRVYGDGNKYYKLYKANEERIEDPNLLLAGQVLVTPKF